MRTCDAYVLYVKYPYDFRITFWLQSLSKPCSVPSTLSDWLFWQRLDSSFLYSTIFCFWAGLLLSGHMRHRMSDWTFTWCTSECPLKQCLVPSENAAILAYIVCAPYYHAPVYSSATNSDTLCTCNNNSRNSQNPTVQKSFPCVNIPQVFSCLVNIKVAMFMSLEDLSVGVSCDACSAWLFLYVCSTCYCCLM